jgi:hypothetical protein
MIIYLLECTDDYTGSTTLEAVEVEDSHVDVKALNKR